MPEQFTVFTARNREATLTDLDLVNEPDTTVIHWQIERNDSGSWRHMVGGSVTGRNGDTPHKPSTSIATNIGGIRGQDMRGVIWFESAGDQRDQHKRWGIDGETY
jgi:hypothetical protein